MTNAQCLMDEDEDAPASDLCLVERKLNSNSIRKRTLVKSRFPSPSSTSKRSNVTETTGASSRTSSIAVMPPSNCTKKSDAVNENKNAIPQVILLGQGLLADEKSDGINILNTSVAEAQAEKEKLDVSHTTDTSTDSSITSTTSSNNALGQENAENAGTLIATKSTNVTGGKEGRSISSFNMFRIQYLVVHTAIMLADGLQGTHLYVLYEGYGYSVSSLYSLGFVAGAFTSPFIGPVVDKIGRKKAAMLYCFLEMIINYLELFPIFIGLITSRIIGGITTNLLFSVFESWLVSEHRSRGFEEEKLEIILRDSTIVSNSAAIVSGYLAHCLASNLGAVGPFQGAVVLTSIALVLVGVMWTENFGTGGDSTSRELTTWKSNMVGAYKTIINDSKIFRIGLIQGLTQGSLQTFVFLWSPALRAFATHSPSDALGLDKDGQPAYGLLFGAFMACGVLGGFAEPVFHKAMTTFTSPKALPQDEDDELNDESEKIGDGEIKPVAVDFLCTMCYLVSAVLFLVPVMVAKDSAYSFSICAGAFLVYEFLVGLYMPCEGVIRSIYMPNDSICSLMTMLRVIVNVAVALGVISTNYISFTSAFATLSMMMVVAAVLQISLVPREEVAQIFKRFGFSRSVKRKSA